MLKHHSLHGHLYYYIGDYRAYLPYSVQLKFIYRGTDKPMTFSFLAWTAMISIRLMADSDA